MAVLLGMNLATLVLFASELAGLPWLDIFESVPLNILGLAAAVGFHWWLIGRIQARESRSGDAAIARTAVAPKHLWLWYLIASVTFLFVGVVLAIHR